MVNAQSPYLGVARVGDVSVASARQTVTVQTKHDVGSDDASSRERYKELDNNHLQEAEPRLNPN